MYRCPLCRVSEATAVDFKSHLNDASHLQTLLDYFARLVSAIDALSVHAAKFADKDTALE